MFIVLGFAALVGLIGFINSFDLIDFKITTPGIFLLFSSLTTIAISVVVILRIVKKQKFGFLALSFFLLSFLFGLLYMIIIGGAGLFISTFIFGLLGTCCTIYATTPVERLTDPKRYMEYLEEATMIDYILIGAYFLFSLVFLISMASFMSKVKSFFK